MTDWGCHTFGGALFCLGLHKTGPVEIIPPENPRARSGVTYRYKNGVEMIHGRHPTVDIGVSFVGTKGEVFVDRGKIRSKPESILKEELGDNDVRLYKSPGQQRDWLNCVRSRKRPICDVEIGARSVTVCHLGNLAYWNHRKLKWDPKKWRFVGDDEATTWLDRERRDPYELPKV